MIHKVVISFYIDLPVARARVGKEKMQLSGKLKISSRTLQKFF
jgi:hypothetical protein